MRLLAILEKELLLYFCKAQFQLVRGRPKTIPSSITVFSVPTGEIGDTVEFFLGTGGGVGDGANRESRAVDTSCGPVVGNLESRLLGISVHPASGSEFRVGASVDSSKCVTSRMNGIGADLEGSWELAMGMLCIATSFSQSSDDFGVVAVSGGSPFLSF